MIFGITLGFEIFKEGLYDIHLFNLSWLIALIIIALTVVFITRDKSDWGKLFLPVSMGYMALGLDVDLIIITIASITFILNIFNFNQLQNLLQPKVFIPKREERESVFDNLITNPFKQTKGVFDDFNTIKTKQKVKSFLKKDKNKEISKTEPFLDFNNFLTKVGNQKPKKIIPIKHKIKPKNIKKKYKYTWEEYLKRKNK